MIAFFDLLYEVFLKLVLMSLSATLIGGILLVLRKVGGISPIWKGRMWLFVIFALVFPYRLPTNSSFMPTQPESTYSMEESNARYWAEVYERGTVVFEEHIWEVEEITEEELEELWLEVKELQRKTLIYERIPSVLWCVGGVVLSLYFVICHCRLCRKIKERALDVDEEKVKILESCQQRLGVWRYVKMFPQTYLKSPAVFGLRYPKIILPDYVDELSEENLRYIFYHELAHVKRMDLHKNLGLLLLQIVYWFNPFIWLIFQYIREDMEVLNDDYVLNCMEEEEFKAYSLSLVEILGRSQNVSFAPKLLTMVDGVKNTKRRISVMKSRELFGKYRVATSVTCVLLGIFFLSGFMTETPSKMGAYFPREHFDVIMPCYSVNPLGERLEEGSLHFQGKRYFHLLEGEKIEGSFVISLEGGEVLRYDMNGFGFFSGALEGKERFCSGFRYDSVTFGYVGVTVAYTTDFDCFLVEESEMYRTFLASSEEKSLEEVSGELVMFDWFAYESELEGMSREMKLKQDLEERMKVEIEGMLLDRDRFLGEVEVRIDHESQVSVIGFEILSERSWIEEIVHSVMGNQEVSVVLGVYFEIP